MKQTRHFNLFFSVTRQLRFPSNLHILYAHLSNREHTQAQVFFTVRRVNNDQISYVTGVKKGLEIPIA